MLIVDFVRWWYSRGWFWAANQLLVVNAKKILNFFSVTDLAKTLFSPFRQDSLQITHAPISVKLQALGGNIISRIFGFFIRMVLIIVGIILLALSYIYGTVLLLLWPLSPLVPVISVMFILLKVGT